MKLTPKLFEAAMIAALAAAVIWVAIVLGKSPLGWTHF